MHPEAADTAEVEERAPAGVIHDLGYRHYDGRRLGRRVIRWSLYLDGLKGAYGLGRTARQKIMPMLLLVAMCLPALIMVVMTALLPVDDLVADPTGYVFSMQVLVAVYVAGQAPAGVSRDLRFRVVPLYFSRPLERADYVIAKFAALASAVAVLVTAPLVVLFVGALLAGLPLGQQVPGFARATAGAVVLSIVLAGIGLVIAAVTPRRGLGVAAVVTVLLVLAGVQATAQDIAWTQGAERTAGYLGLLSPFAVVDGIQSALLGAEGALFSSPTQVVDGVVFLVATIVFVAGCYAALLLRYRRVAVS